MNGNAVRRLWMGMAAFYAALLLHIVFYAAQSGQGRSLSFGALAAANVALALAAAAFAAWIKPERLECLRRAAQRWQTVFIVIGVILLGILGLGTRPEWVYAHMAVALAAAFSLAYWTLFGERAPFRRTPALVGGFAALAAGVTVLRILALSTYPDVHVIDEPWILSWAYSYLRVGYPLDWIMLGVDHGPAFYLPRFPQAMAAWLSLVGVGLWEGRLFSFLVAMAVIPFAAVGAANLYNRTTGWMTAGTLFASAVYMVAARIRHDVGLALALAVSLWLYSEALKRERQWLHFLAGLVMGLGMFSHYHAGGFGAAMLAGLYGPRYFQQARRGRWWPEAGLWLYGLGGLAGGAAAAAVQILPDVNLFLSRLPPRSPQDFSALVGTFAGHIRVLAETSRFEFVLVAVGLAAAFYRRDWTPALVAVLGLAALSLMAVITIDYYHVPLMPIYAVLVARLFAAGFWRGATTPGHSAAVFVFFAAVGLGITLSAPFDHLRSGKPLRLPSAPAAAWVLENIPPEQTILADNLYFIWLHEYRFASILTPSHLLADEDIQRYRSSPAALWDDLEVEIIIYDPGLPTHDQLEWLFEQGYLGAGGFTLAAQFDDVKVYRRG